MKTKILFLALIFLPLYIQAQELTTLRIIDWNNLKKSGFFDSKIQDNHQNVPGNHGWYWGINIGHTNNVNVASAYNYGGQLLFALNTKAEGLPEAYLRSTNIDGKGTWAKIIHSKGDHAIDGKLTTKEIEIKINTGADFVFAPDYKLPTLTEVESFVKQNKHLPDIPSEKEMQENGLNLNDMQIKLLQKIEELTLYVIEQNKKIEQLESQNTQIKQQLNIK